MAEVMEGYMLRLWDGSLWMVKGSEFPEEDRVRAFPRRVGGYKCSGLNCGYKLAKEIYPWLLRYDACVDMHTPQVPLVDIEEVLDPLDERSETDPHARRLKRLLEAESGVEVGVTGSSLLGVGRDVDLVVYGLEASAQVYEVLSTLRRRGVLKPLSGSALMEEYRKNLEDTTVGLSRFRRRSAHRLLVGVYEGKPYSIRLVARRRPLYGCRRTIKISKVEMMAKVLDSSLGFVTPAIYRVQPLSGPPGYVDDVEFLVTSRIRYMELPEDIVVQVSGYLEYIPGLGYAVVPDHPGGRVVTK